MRSKCSGERRRRRFSPDGEMDITADFGSAILGSNPGRGTIHNLDRLPMTTSEDFREFSPRQYLSEQYKTIMREEAFILRFLHETYQNFGRKNLSIIEVGGGPTIYQLISASKYAKEIVFTDFLQKNLEGVQAWVHKKPEAFNWRTHIQLVASLEGQRVEKIEKRLRTALRRFLLLDILKMGQVLRKQKFDVVSSHFCADSITNNKRVFSQAVRAIVSLLAPRGILVMSLLKGTTFYDVGRHSFPAYSLDEHEVKKILKRLGFNTFEIQTIEVEKNGNDNANICLWARR